jgi:hypothetical protein
MADTPHDPADRHDNIDDLFAAFDAGELDIEPVSAAERQRMASAARAVSHAWAGAEPPPELRAKVLEHIRAQADRPPAPVADLDAARERRQRNRRRLLGSLAAAAATVAVVVALTGGHSATPPKLFDAALTVAPGSPSPNATGGTELHRGTYGYDVRVDADGLAPAGDGYYEIWYIAKDDTRAKPDRVAVATFRPKHGSIHTWLPAAFDGSRFSRVSITLQPPGRGDPSHIGRQVLVGPSLPVDGKSAG